MVKSNLLVISAELLIITSARGGSEEETQERVMEGGKARQSQKKIGDKFTCKYISDSPA